MACIVFLRHMLNMRVLHLRQTNSRPKGMRTNEHLINKRFAWNCRAGSVMYICSKTWTALPSTTRCTVNTFCINVCFSVHHVDCLSQLCPCQRLPTNEQPLNMIVSFCVCTCVGDTNSCGEPVLSLLFVQKYLQGSLPPGPPDRH